MNRDEGEQLSVFIVAAGLTAVEDDRGGHISYIITNIIPTHK